MDMDRGTLFGDRDGKYHREGLIILLLVALSSVVYMNSIFGGFVLDDMVLIQKNPVIHSLFDIRLLTYRWLRTFSYAVDYSLWGLNPVGYHLSNIFYNTLTVLLVYFLTKRLTKNLTITFVASLLFALHPIHTEAVSYLSGRRDILSALFYLLGFILYLKGRGGGGRLYYAGAFLAYLLSISAKEMGVTLPVLIVAYEILHEIDEDWDAPASTIRLFVRAVRSNLARFRWLITLSILLVAGYLYVDLFLEHASGMVSAKGIKWWGGNPVSNFATVATVLASYMKKLLFPVVLRFDYRMFPLRHSLLDMGVISSLALLAGLLLLSFVFIRRRPAVTFGIWFFFITLLPVMQIIPHHMLMAEHYLYLPSYGFCLLAGILAERIHYRHKLIILFLAAGVLVCLLFFVRTVARNQDWLDTFTLTAEGLRHDPKEPVYHFFRGHAYHLVHLERSAWRELEKAVYPNLYRDSKLFAIRAVILFEQGEYEKGEKETKKALDIDPDDQMALVNGGYFALMMGDNQKALHYYLKVRPDYEGGGHLQNIAKIYLEEGKVKRAEKTMRRALSLHSYRAVFHYDLAEVLIRELKFDQAAEQYKKVLRFAKNDPEPSEYLKDVPQKLKWAERFRQRLSAVKSNMGGGETGREIAYVRLYLDAGNNGEAARRLRSAIGAGDDSYGTRCLLGSALLREGKRDEALKAVEGIKLANGMLSDEELATLVDIFSQNLRINKAIDFVRELIRRHPGKSSYRDQFAALKGMGELQKRWRRLDYEGDPFGAAIAEGDLYVKVGRIKEALRCYESAIQQKPDDPDLLRKLYSFYEPRGYPYRRKAIQTGRTLLKIDPKDSRIALRLWRFYYDKVEDYESALIYLERAVKADHDRADNRKTRSALKTLKQYVRTYKSEVVQ